MNRIDIDINYLVERYTSGISLKKLSEEIGIDRNTLRKRLVKAGITPRGRREAELLKWSQMTTEQRSRQVAAANEAARGRVDREESKIQRAQTRWERQLGISDIERQVAVALTSIGLEPIHQLPVGPYNIDIALKSKTIAVELHGGGWHAAGRHWARRSKRLEHILGHRWLLIEVWHCATGMDFMPLAKYLHSLADEMSRNPSLIGQHKMVFGTGKPVPRARSYGHDIAAVEASSRRDPRTGKYLGVA